MIMVLVFLLHLPQYFGPDITPEYGICWSLCFLNQHCPANIDHQAPKDQLLHLLLS